MSSIGVSALAFGLVFGGALLGLFISTRLPEHHQSSGSKDVVRMGMGMVGTIAALVLGLLVSSAKTFCDGQRDELMQMSANVVLVDRLLQHYGPEANGARESLRLAVGRILTRIWPEERTGKATLLPMTARNEDVYDQIDALAPKDDRQRALQSRALSLMLSMGQMRWLIFEQTSEAVSTPLLIVIIFWLTSIFVSWGLYSPVNATTVASFFAAALSVSGAILMIMELYSPYSGLLRVSSAPLRLAYATLGQ